MIHPAIWIEHYQLSAAATYRKARQDYASGDYERAAFWQQLAAKKSAHIRQEYAALGEE